MRELYKQGKSIAANAHSHTSKRFNAGGATHVKNPPAVSAFSKASPYKTGGTTTTKSRKKKRIASAAAVAATQSRLAALGAAPPDEAQAASSTSSNLNLQDSVEYKEFSSNPGMVARVFASVFDVFFNPPPNSSYTSGAGSPCATPASPDIYEILSIAHTPLSSSTPNSPPVTPSGHVQPRITDSTLLKENAATGLQMASNFAAAVDTAAETLLTDLSASTTLMAVTMLSHGAGVGVLQGSEILGGHEEETREFMKETPLEVVEVDGEASGMREGRTVDEEMMDEFEVIHHEFDVDVEEMEDGWSRIV